MASKSVEGLAPAHAMRANFWPLSGDVGDIILPWRWLQRFAGQLGLVNIHLGRTADPDGERRILHEAGSYGRQLGHISEALQAVVDATLTKDGELDRDKLDDNQIAALVRLKQLLEEVENAKKG